MTKSHNDDVSAAARAYIAKGLRPVPIPYGKKGPTIDQWQNLSLSVSDVALHFGSAPANIGVILGVPSGIVDVDIDVDGHRPLRSLLPATPARFGRKSRPETHYIYRIDGHMPPTRQFHAPDKRMIIEVRSTGAQTVFPPSMLTAKGKKDAGESQLEKVSWQAEGEPSAVKGDVLIRSAAKFAAAVIFSENWPQEGGRHIAYLALAGMLAREEWPEDEIEDFLSAIAADTADEEARSRIKGIARTIERTGNDEPTTGYTRLCELIGDVAVKAACDHLGVSAPRKIDERSEWQAVAEPIRKNAEFWRSMEGESYITLRVDGVAKNFLIRSGLFRQQVNAISSKSRDKVLTNHSFELLTNFFEAKAYTGPVHQSFVRVGERDGAIYIDLCNDRWEAIRIDADGWSIVSDPPVKFIRSPEMLPMQVPERGGSLEALRPLVNVASEEDFILLIGWILTAFMPYGPFPILIAHGEQGCAKSTLLRLLRRLIDPNALELRALSRSPYELVLSSASSRLHAYDNISNITREMADALCRLATGGGVAVRKLYTDRDQMIVNVKRPVMLNSIGDHARFGDLAERSFKLRLVPIPEDKRRLERMVDAEIARALPGLLGAVCDALAAILKHLPQVKAGQLPRMADAAEWVLAAEIGKAVPWAEGRYHEVVMAAARHGQTDLIFEHPLYTRIMKLLRRNAWSFEGTMTELLDSLNSAFNEYERRPLGWPSQPNWLSNNLHELAPALREAGIEFVHVKRDQSQGNRKIYRLYRLDDVGNF